MLACNKLCIDPCDGSPVVDFRIENGCVETRAGLDSTQHWQRLTPEQLTSHVMSNSVVAHGYLAGWAFIDWSGHAAPKIHAMERKSTQSAASTPRPIDYTADLIHSHRAWHGDPKERMRCETIRFRAAAPPHVANCRNQAITLKCPAQGHDEIAVGTPVARCPPHRPGRALVSASGSYLG